MRYLSLFFCLSSFIGCQSTQHHSALKGDKGGNGGDPLGQAFVDVGFEIYNSLKRMDSKKLLSHFSPHFEKIGITKTSAQQQESDRLLETFRQKLLLDIRADQLAFKESLKDNINLKNAKAIVLDRRVLLHRDADEKSANTNHALDDRISFNIDGDSSVGLVQGIYQFSTRTLRLTTSETLLNSEGVEVIPAFTQFKATCDTNGYCDAHTSDYGYTVSLKLTATKQSVKISGLSFWLKRRVILLESEYWGNVFKEYLSNKNIRDISPVVKRLVYHEYLRLLGVDEDGYPISREFDSSYKSEKNDRLLDSIGAEELDY